MAYSSSSNGCIFYKVAIGADGHPLEGTMEGYGNAKIPDPCDHALVTPYQRTVPSGHTQCRFKNGKRYFYKVQTPPGSSTTIIVPNSMFSLTGAPSSRCVGNETLLEFITWK